MPGRDISGEMAFARRLQPHAETYYQEFFGDHDRVDVEGTGDDQAGIAREMDFSGIDQLVKPDTHRTYHVAQRFRRERDSMPTDFSIRYTSQGYVSEYNKILQCYADPHAHLPSLYAFGVVDGEDLDDGFIEFFFLDVDTIAEALSKGKINYHGPYPNQVNGEYDGTKAVYLPKDDLRRVGAVAAEYSDGVRVD